MKIQWLKLEVDIFDNAKIKKILRMNGGKELFVLWVMLLTLGMKCKRYGVLEIAEGIPYSASDIAAECDMTTEAVENGIKLFHGLRMLNLTEGSTIEITNFARYQSLEKIEHTKELARIRQEKRRRKQKQELLEYKEQEESEIRGEVTNTSRDSHAYVTRDIQPIPSENKENNTTPTSWNKESIRVAVSGDNRPTSPVDAYNFMAMAYQHKTCLPPTINESKRAISFFNAAELLPMYKTIAETLHEKGYVFQFALTTLGELLAKNKKKVSA